MKLRLDLLQTDSACRFDISPGKVSQIFTTWIKQLGVLILWPSKSQVRKTLLQCFMKLYPKLHTIIDCTEIYIETPSLLDSKCLLWSDSSIRPNGLISWVSPAYGGRTSDAYIVRDSWFLDLLEPYDQIMADRGFKTKTDLALKQFTLAIPPSAASGCQMVSRDVKETSTVANVHIYKYVEQVIKNLKDY